MTTLSVGAHSLTAAYPGDGTFASAVSAAISDPTPDFLGATATGSLVRV